MSENASMISADNLCKLTELTDKRHRQLAAQGWFPAPNKGQYQLVKTIRGLLKYYREGSHRLNQLKEEKLQEDIKLTTAEASIKQMEEEKLRGDSMDTAAVGKLVNECFLPVRQRIDSLPSEMSSRCNPSDPQLARAALEEWKVGFYAQVSEKLPKQKSTARQELLGEASNGPKRRGNAGGKARHAGAEQRDKFYETHLP